MQTHQSSGRVGGFALVVTLSLMILLTILAVGMLSLSAVTLRNGVQGFALAEARANARMALILAIGELQKQAGPDQRVTATSSLANATENPNWTGVWRADLPGSTPTWLVSGSNPDPFLPLPNPSVSLFPADPAIPGSKDLRAPLVKSSGSTPGYHAWWVGDEGVKARVDLAKPKAAAPNNITRLARSQSSLEPGLTHLGAEFVNLGHDAAIDKTSLITMETLGIASSKAMPRKFFHDLTTGGYGIPVNVSQGRLKTDLSLIFDSSQQGKAYATDYLGATGDNGLPVQRYTVSSQDKFYLSDAIRARVATGTGPNWGILWNYARLWRNISNHQIPMIATDPSSDTEIRLFDWLPYKNDGTLDFRKDRQHTNLPVAPVISHLQIGFRLKTRPTGQPDRYQLQLETKPVIGIWNPYNVPITNASYSFQWGVYPWLRYGSGTSAGSATALPADTDPTGNTNAVAEVWMREQWRAGEISVGGEPLTRFDMEIQSVNLQPGEFRLFSVTTSKNIASTNTLSAGWNENAAYVTDLKKANGSPAILSGTIANGTPRYLWIGDMFLDDMQKTWSPTARQRYPLSLNAQSANSFIAFKGSGGTSGHISRYANIWNPGLGDTATNLFPVPERILSGAIGGTSTSKAKYKVTDLAQAGGHEHLATWSFFLRPSAQMEDANQRARGWIDANPRAISINPHWEGAVASDGKRQGWNATSYLMGGAHGTGLPAKVVGDGGFGNRGLVAEAGEGAENIEPQIGGIVRYQGLGGATNTSVGGQANVMLYDIPRSPLVSIGQFQHATLSRYSFEPGFVVGNSYADLKIPLNAAVANNFNGIVGHNITDISYDINRRLWDDFHFSTLGVDYNGATGISLDSAYSYTGGALALAHPRIWYVPNPADTTIDKMITDAATRAPEAVSARIRIGGAFNINSTSKTAWKALLSSMAASEFPRIDPANTAAAPVWESPRGIRFNRFGHVATNAAYEKGGDGVDPSFWLGWREINADELDKLAEEIVKEVKARGPFRSFAEFVNRNPNDTNIEHQRKGALQAAIDRTINKDLPASISDAPAQKPVGPFSDAINGESQAVGHAGYLMQGDVLQSLAPILQPRSDYFRIRAYGEARDSTGKVTASAWCEAFVQRDTAYVDPSDRPEIRSDDPALKPANKSFGRHFDIVSFRWLSPSEISPTP